MSVSVRLRSAVAADVPSIARIWREGWADAHLGNVPAALVEVRTPGSFAERTPDRLGDTIVAVRDGAVVGFVMVDGSQVDHLYLDRSGRGTGIGAVLLEAAERVVLAAGHPRAWLAVATGNHGARRFYARQGWTDEGSIAHPAPVSVDVDCHRFVSPPR
ncbi:GNAT family N-acetyltransferase [Sphaerisporangium rubeum]|uniref:GNAT superfamily N-acetyltransferase n=1 Tax=Sphaerisporangium rubeum TaxID=321317 RepID=A0A7X0M8X1_9ACTN|nr:GNAT family N-acetyltransferase [Sphaerisporangium rubeum]MBB6474351.1 GNAT superfamily N-acetyltransferase [Sphaerisporangium rubeum]